MYLKGNINLFQNLTTCSRTLHREQTIEKKSVGSSSTKKSSRKRLKANVQICLEISLRFFKH